MDQLDDAHTPSPPPPPSSLTTASPLEIPEVIATVFSWLDDDTINQSVILVCRQWFAWNHHRIFRDFYWNSARSREELETDMLSRFLLFEGGPNRLFCHVRYSFGDPHVDKWRDLGAALTEGRPLRRHVLEMGDAQEPQEQQQGSRETSTEESESGNDERGDDRVDSRRRLKEENEHCGIRYLTITGRLQLDSYMWSILSGLNTLTSLTVKVDSCGWMSLPLIFRSCPQLESLHIETTAWVSIPGSSWMEEDEGERRPQESQAQPQTQAGPGTEPGAGTGLHPQQHQQLLGPLVLRSLVLRNVQFDQRALETFLPAAPLLHRLQIAVWLPHLSHPNRNDFDRIIQLVRTHCSLIKTFHFSYQGLHLLRAAPEDMNAVLELCPRMTECMISAPHFTPELIPRITQDVLTTLEIIGAECSGLHDYLCSAAATHLRHLKAGRTRFPYENMDIWLRSSNGFFPLKGITGGVPGQGQGHGAGSESGSGQGDGQGQRHGQSWWKRRREGRSVWTCRGLLTLHLAIANTSNNPRASRIVFGYISRVCPHLRELEICGPEGIKMDRKIRPTPLCMSLEGGFCLLARLKDLERVFVGIVGVDLNLKRTDLEWMVGACESGGRGGGGGGGGRKVVGSKVQIKNVTERFATKGWNALLKHEKEQESARDHNYQQCTSRIYGDEEQERDCTTIANKQDAELEKSLQDLGLLKDVVHLLQELDSIAASPTSAGRGERCWPFLRRMAVYSGDRQGETFEKEYERLVGGAEEKDGNGLLAGIRSLVGYLAAGMS
ncbi:MAG: hypothetical protein J3R72DRAFT_435370 [Linnemannia gamsii]|nr:MAG: hypothetical protein J3R72DRAFT_435370 [Linnemannia gamsii]